MLGPLTDPVSHRRNGSRAGEDDHFDVVQIGEPFLNDVAVLLAGELNAESRPAPAVDAVFFEHVGEAVVGLAGTHQNDGLL